MLKEERGERDKGECRLFWHWLTNQSLPNNSRRMLLLFSSAPQLIHHFLLRNATCMFLKIKLWVEKKSNNMSRWLWLNSPLDTNSLLIICHFLLTYIFFFVSTSYSCIFICSFFTRRIWLAGSHCRKVLDFWVVKVWG